MGRSPSRSMRSAKCSAVGTDSYQNKTPPHGRGRNEESCSDGERERPIIVPLIVGIVPIGVNPLTVIVPVRVEHVRVAVGNVRDAIRATAHRMLSGLYRICDL